MTPEEVKAQAAKAKEESDQATANAEALKRLKATQFARQQYAAETHPPRKPALVFDGTEDLTGVDWLVDQIIPAEGAGMLFGETDIGKTFIMLDIGVHISANKAWLQHDVVHGTVVFIEAEGGKSFGLRKRAAKLHILNKGQPLLRELGLPFITINIPLGFGPDTTHAELQAYGAYIRGEVEARKLPPVRFVVADTLAQNIRGNVDNNEDMTAFLQAFRAFLKELSAEAVFGMLIHHPGHGNKNRARGAYSLPADLDLIMQLEAEEHDARALTLTCKRMREGELFDAIPLALEKREVLDAKGKAITDRRGRTQTSLVMVAREATSNGDDVDRPLMELVKFVEKHPGLTTAQLAKDMGKGKAAVVKLVDQAVELKVLEKIELKSGKTSQTKQVYKAVPLRSGAM